MTPAVDLDDWYDLVQEPLPSNPPPRPLGTWALAGAALLAAVAVVFAATSIRERGGSGDDDVATIGSSLPPGSSTSTSTARTSTTRERESSTTSSSTSVPDTVAGAVVTRSSPDPTSAPTTAAPSAPPTAPPATSPPPPPPPPPEPAPPQPAPKSSGDLTATARFSRTDPGRGVPITLSLRSVDHHGRLDLVDVAWGDRTPRSVRDETTGCVPGGPTAGHEDRTVQFTHTFAAPGRYTVTVIVRTDDCGGGIDQVTLTGQVLVR